jgi:TRAP transporter TAXI family solute receptor
VSSRLVLPIVVFVLCLVALVGMGSQQHAKRAPLRLVTGAQGGTAQPFGEALAQALGHKGLAVTTVETPGGWENVAVLDRGDAELGLAFNDAPGGEHVRTIAPLLESVLHVVVRSASGVTSVATMRGKRVAIGPMGSGTAGVSVELLRLVGIDVDKDLSALRLAHADAAAAMEKGDLDVAFVLAGLPNPAVARMLRVPGVALLALGTLGPDGTVDGLRASLPFLSTTRVPAGTYGDAPPVAVGTLGCDMLLVARDTVSDDDVHDLTAELFASKSELALREPAVARLSEHFDTVALRFPVHPGAGRYYRRDEPAFIQQWADTISLGLTVAVMVWSAVAAWRTQRQRARRKRVDAYYMEVQAAAEAADAAKTHDDLAIVRKRLHAVRRKAFLELSENRLAADESFTIFQDYLRSELGEIDAAMAIARSKLTRASGDA